MADLEMKREQWKKEQARLRNLLVKEDGKDFLKNLKYVGGVDISFVKDSDRALACFSVMEYPSLKPIETFYHPCLMTEPYMPGFLAFREVHHLVEVVNMFLKTNPAAKTQMLIMVDGNGILHYRGFGSASHLGVVLDIPTLGVGKELLVVDGMDANEIQARCQSEMQKFGDTVDLVGPRTGRLFGSAVFTKSKYEPIYVSIGHKISLETSIDLVLKCCKNRNQLPEPVRLADGLSRDVIKKNPGLTKYFDAKPSPSSSSAPLNPSRSTTTNPPLSWASLATSVSPSPSNSGSSRPPPPSHSSSPLRSSSGAPSSPSFSSKPPPPEKGKGKRGVNWDCSCGASNPTTSDSCQFCYHMKPAEGGGTQHEETPDSSRRKTSWVCRCGQDVVDQVSCPSCHQINM